MEEQNFIEALREGTNEAYNLLLDKYQQKVFNTCISFVPNKEDAEDLAQDVFIEVFNSISKFKGNSKLSTWIYRISVNKSLEFIRKSNTKKRFGFMQSLLGNHVSLDRSTYFTEFNHPGIVLEQKDYIENYITTFENIMLSDDFADESTGYPAYVDVNSFVDYFLTNEICKNLDAYRLSTFMHKDKDSEGGKLKMGPVWDFNISLGNADYCSGNQTAGWVLAHRDACPNDQWITHFWWYRLMEDIEFQKKLKTRWNELRATVWSNENLLGKIDSLVALLNGGAQQRNFQKWDILSTYIWPNNIVANNYEGEIDYLKNFLTGRIAWMDLVIQQIDEPDVGDDIEVTVLPNPFQHEVFFQYSTTSNKLLKFAIYDSQGFLLDFLQPQGRNGVTLVPWERAAEVPKGIYHYAVWLNNKVIQTGSMIKQP